MAGGGVTTIEEARAGLAAHPNRGPHRKFYQCAVLVRLGHDPMHIRTLGCPELDALLREHGEVR